MSLIIDSKVVAAGYVSSTKLRVTLLLSPHGGEDEQTGMDEKTLENWPAAIWAALRDCGAKQPGGGGWLITLQAARVSGDPDCGGEKFADVAKHPVMVHATASWAKQTWAADHGKLPVWVQSLWTDAFARDMPKGTQVWSTLRTALGGSQPLRPGKIKDANTKPSGVPDGNRKDGVKTATTGLRADAKSVQVDAILPARQSDLALLLETQRAREFCSTVVCAHADAWGEVNVECECAKEAGDPNGKYDLTSLWQQAAARYSNAAKPPVDIKTGKCDPNEKPSAPWALDPNNVSTLERTDLEKQLHGPLDSHETAMQSQDTTHSAKTAQFLDNQAAPISMVRQRFFALQSSPALSRLFGLTVDLEIDTETSPPEFASLLAKGDVATFLMLSLKEPCLPPSAAAPTIWTLAKFMPATDPYQIHFWPAARVELRGIGTNQALPPALSQFNGMVVAGQQFEAAKRDKDDVKEPTPLVSRFMLTSLDVPAAAEAAVDKRRRHDVPDPSTLAASKPPLADKPNAFARKTFSTTGWALLDRGRLEQSVRQFAAGSNQSDQTPSDTVVLDAEDLTIGYRLDVAVPVASPHGDISAVKWQSESIVPEWRSLMARRVDHGIHERFGSAVGRVVPMLMGGTEKRFSSWQETLDDAVLSLPARLVGTPSTVGAPTANCFVEEAVAVWTGEPMAAHCAGDADDKSVDMQVGAGMRISLPAKNEQSRQPPLLRFGTRYRFGLRVVYAGAISLPLDEAKRHYDSDEQAAGLLTVPSKPWGDSGALRRFLRHERIDAPFLLIHQDLALRGNGPMGAEHTAHAIVRTTDSSDSQRGQPSITQRIFLPPTVDLHSAALHGVFDGLHHAKHPPQGLQGVRFDANGGGFPFLAPVSDHGKERKPVVGINGATHDPAHEISWTAKTRGDLVYVEGSGGERKIPYYPDPAARRYAIAVRHFDTHEYLPGPPVTLEIGSEGSYPEVHPLVLEIERNLDHPRRGASPKLEDVLVPVSRPNTPRVRNGNYLSVRLAPGDDFAIDVWCLPDEDRLARWFALPEAIGVLALAIAKGTDAKSPDLHAALRQLLPEPVCQNVSACLVSLGHWQTPMPEDLQGTQGVGGLGAPSTKIIGAIARALHDTLCRRPLDEIAAVQTFRATHATLRPMVEPAFPSEGVTGHPWLTRIAAKSIPAQAPSSCPAPVSAASAAAAASAGTVVAASAASAAPASGPVPSMVGSAPSTGASGPAAISPPSSGSTSSGAPVPPVFVPPEYQLLGDLLIDPSTTGAFEIIAQTAFPTRKVMDDSHLGRSQRDRRQGTWPHVNGKPLTPKEVFGFFLEDDDTVVLPLTKVSLLRVENLPFDFADKLDPSHRAAFSLDRLGSGLGPTPIGTVKTRHIFPDQKARKLKLSVRASARNELQMRTSNSGARDRQWLVAGKDVLPPKDAPPTIACVWLDAAVRPSDPVAYTPTPAFSWRPTADVGQERVALLRIPLSRGWFSSGEDERLGIVVWPPRAFGDRKGSGDLAQVQDKLDRDLAPSLHTPMRNMRLDEFVDEDLGPGGAFVTRWGSDPIRVASDFPNGTPTRAFIGQKAFRDVGRETPGGFKAEVVTGVRMPVRTTPNTLDNQIAEPPSLTLDVSLILYTPRFDRETEQWYVDAEIEHPDEARPFLRLGLVRYQHHAPPELQVSYPVVQWVQLLPRRQVRAWLEAPNASRRDLHIEVCGLGETTGDPDPAKITCPEPIMTMRLLRQYRSEVGLTCRHVLKELSVRRDTVGATTRGRVLADPATGSQVCWVSSEAFEVDAARDDAQQAEYTVFVEERPSMLPATFKNEPVDSMMAAGQGIDGRPPHLMECGPRFSSVIRLGCHEGDRARLSDDALCVEIAAPHPHRELMCPAPKHTSKKKPQKAIKSRHSRALPAQCETKISASRIRRK